MDNLACLTPVTLNLFQGPSFLSSSAVAARWMLKQVQHNGIVI